MQGDAETAANSSVKLILSTPALHHAFLYFITSFNIMNNNLKILYNNNLTVLY